MRKAIAAAAAALLLAGAAPAAYKGYTKLFVFGDSLVDTGNAHYGSLALGGPDPTPAGLGYVGNRFSNGANFADDLGVAINGSPSTAYLPAFAGSNFSVGGADAQTKPGERSPAFAGQLDRFAASGQRIGQGSLVLVTFGGNDIRDVLTDTGSLDFSSQNSPAVVALVAGLQRLVGYGAQNIVVTGLPDISQLPDTIAKAAATPDPQAVIAAAKQRSEDLDAAFATAVAGFAASTSTATQFFDLLDYERKLIADPAAYGLPAPYNPADPTPFNTTSSCQRCGVVAVVGQSCRYNLYFDDIHPTAQVHQAIATGILGQLMPAVPEPATWATMVLGFGLAGGAMRRRRIAMA